MQPTWKNYRGMDVTDKEWKEFKLKTIEQRIRKNNAEVRLHTYFKKNRTRKNK
jgi:hypothetical protein